MPNDVVLPVTYEPQIHSYMCGAACINMVLSRWGKNRPQNDVWNDVKNNTGTTRPGNARPDPHQYPTQLCEECSKNPIYDNGQVYGDYWCWYTAPVTLAKVINFASSVHMVVHHLPITDPYEVFRKIADSVATFGTPAVYTAEPSLHWMVGYGYQYETVQPTVSSAYWNGQYITGIYVHNPTPGSSQSSVYMVTPRVLGDVGIEPMHCGVNANTYPVVTGSASAQPPGTSGPDPGGATSVGLNHEWFTEFLATLAKIVTWIDPRKFLRYLTRPRRPGPPPR